MVKRYLCLNCKKVYRGKASCAAHCGNAVIFKDYHRTTWGLLTLGFGIVALLMIIGAFVLGLGILVLWSFGPIIIAIIIDTVDAKKIDQMAYEDINKMLASTPNFVPPQ